MDDKKHFQSIIDKKCPYCFRKDECMLFSSRHRGIKLCLGPFKDDNDWTEKIREDHRKEEEAKKKEREAGLRKLQRQNRREEYRINRMLAEFISEGEGSSEDEH